MGQNCTEIREGIINAIEVENAEYIKKMNTFCHLKPQDGQSITEKDTSTLGGL